MPPKITRVRWSASDIPWGMIFDEATGTFSGVPEDEGEYTVPVKVQTNYGEDMKDVIISVNPPVYSQLNIEPNISPFSVNTFSAYSGLSQTQNINAGDTISAFYTDSANTKKAAANDAVFEFSNYEGYFRPSASYAAQGSSLVSFGNIGSEEGEGLINLTNMTGSQTTFVSANLDKAQALARAYSVKTGISGKSIASLKSYYPYATITATLQVKSPSLGVSRTVNFVFLIAW